MVQDGDKKPMTNQNRRYAVKISEVDMKRLRARADIIGYLFHVADQHLKESLISSPDNDLSLRGLVAFSPVSANP